MGTRLDQFDFLLSGYVDPNTGLVGAGYTAYFYAAGTTTAKDVYTAYDGTGGAVTSVTLDATGSVAVWGDGIYKVVIKNLSGATVDTYDGVKVFWPGYNVVSTAAATYQVTINDDGVLCDPTSTNQTITLPAASAAMRPIYFKRIGGGSNTLTIVPSGDDTIDGATSKGLVTLNSDITVISDGANWYGQAAASTNADTLNGYTADTSATPGTVPVRNGGGTIDGAVPAASDTVAGISELAILAEMQAGTSTSLVPPVSIIRTGLIVNGTAAASTSGSAVNFGSIPTWVKRINIMLDAVSLSGTDTILVQIGDSGGIETTGYTGGFAVAGGTNNVAGFTLSSGFGAGGGNAAATSSGFISLILLDAATNMWAATGVVGRSDGFTASVGGIKALSAALDRLTIIPAGVNTFDAGRINISYE